MGSVSPKPDQNCTIQSKNQNWIKEYIFWELELFKLVGYDLELKKLVDKKLIGNQFQYVSKSTVEKKIIPNFLIHHEY